MSRYNCVYCYPYSWLFKFKEIKNTRHLEVNYSNYDTYVEENTYGFEEFLFGRHVSIFIIQKSTEYTNKIISSICMCWNIKLLKTFCPRYLTFVSVKKLIRRIIHGKLIQFFYLLWWQCIYSIESKNVCYNSWNHDCHCEYTT